jgi:hypothetical protein
MSIKSELVCYSNNALDIYSGALGSDLGRTPDILIDVFRGFHQSFQVKHGTVSRLWHNRFLLNPFLFIILHSSYQPTLCNLYIESRKINQKQKNKA